MSNAMIGLAIFLLLAGLCVYYRKKSIVWQNRYITAENSYRSLENKVSNMPLWTQMLQSKYIGVHYFEYSKLGIQRFGGTANADDCEDYYTNSHLFSGFYNGRKDFDTSITFDESIDMYVAICVIRNRWEAAGTYVRGFMSYDEAMVRIASFLFQDEYQKGTFSPPQTAEEYGFSLKTIDDVLQLHSAYSNKTGGMYVNTSSVGSNSYVNIEKKHEA